VLRSAVEHARERNRLEGTGRALQLRNVGSVRLETAFLDVRSSLAR